MRRATPEVALDLSSQTRDPGGDERPWREIRQRLVRIALALGVPPGDVPDVVQDALLAAHRALPSFDPAAGTFEAWIATILVRRAKNLARGRRRRMRLLEAFRRLGLPLSARATAATDRVEARIIIGKLLGCLTAVQREVVALYEIGELDAGETSRALGITAAGVRSIARDARRRLAAEARLLQGAGADAGARAGVTGASRPRQEES